MANPASLRAATLRYRNSHLETCRVRESTRYIRHHARVAAAKAGGCMDCGATGVERGSASTALHFHHRDPATKRIGVGLMVGYSDANFDIEVAKCDVLCQPCHKARHASA